MQEGLSSDEIYERRMAYLDGLFLDAIHGDTEAGGTLSKIALGGSEEARGLVEQMDRILAGGIEKLQIQERKVKHEF